ncbi:MAG: 16S rRNA (uracil(1498)-N(3))-methyltransferase [Candidatus Altimarinota bacterium]
MHRFFISQTDLSKNSYGTNDKELCHQFSKVLKLRVDEKIILLDNTEHEYLAELTMVSKSRCEAKILEKTKKPDISSKTAVHLFVPPLKNQNRWELILEKGTELGVASFTPLITERTEVKELRKLDRLERIVKEAAEQSGRTKLPIINEPITFQKIVQTQDLASQYANLIASLYEGARPISHYKLTATTSNLFLGPVGDFTTDEVEFSVEHNFYPVSLGSQILRTETAAIALSALLLCHSGAK